ncbi:hypothetical protein SAMN04487950_4645 [Halogranum rubrum]|uniref:Uncharacterized protein n=1 Tax=Halogranum rubrum TaxID=553466 RepID=A0A1I4JTH3_9EURY|nr:hypothetical protein [Halogranum rubrum]SFL69859.1 hypothetical protein SAMN04487950_4645 [Halogranum rubrum]
MSYAETTHGVPDEEWPDYALEFTFNPRDVTLSDEFDPDEVVIFEPSAEDIGSRWISGKRDSYVAVETMR